MTGAAVFAVLVVSVGRRIAAKSPLVESSIETELTDLLGT